MSVLSQLIDAFCCLPGVGPKSSQRIVFHLLQRQRQRGLHLAKCLENAMQVIGYCNRCNNYTERPLCSLCLSNDRNNSIICVVESPGDMMAIEQSNGYQGKYFLLMGKISPLEGLGPEEIGLPKLHQLIKEESITEVIIALSPSIEGQATIHYIHQLLASDKVQITQLAHGIPSGGELEFLDGYTISSALRNRALIHE